MSDTKQKPSKRETPFINEASMELLLASQTIENLSPDGRRERDSQLRARAEARRRGIWAQWLRVSNWTTRDAACLFAGQDPRERLLGSSRIGGADRREILNLEARIRALADEHLKPVTRSTHRTLRRFRSFKLIQLGAREKLGYAPDMAALATSMRLDKQATKRPSDSRKPRAATLQRETSTVELAKMLVASGIGEFKDKAFHLPISTPAFRREAKARLPNSTLSNCSDKTLNRARLNRSTASAVPRVFLAPGNPRKD